MALKQIYQDFINCLNSQDWGSLANFVAPDVTHNTRPLGLSGYRKMLEENFEDIPDLKFKVEMTVSEPPYLAASVRLLTQGRFSWSSHQRPACILPRERLLPVPGGKDYLRAIGARQGSSRRAVIGARFLPQAAILRLKPSRSATPQQVRLRLRASSTSRCGRSAC